MRLAEILQTIKTSETYCTHNCAEAVGLAVIKAGLPDADKFTISCTKTYENLMKSENWAKISYPVNDAIIFFDWDFSGDCDHVGIIQSFDDDYITYANFNGSKSREFSIDRINRHNGMIKGIFTCRSALVTKAKKYTDTNTVIRKGDAGGLVKLIQALVNVKADGMFGDDTEKAVKRFQVLHNCEADGEVGNETFTAMSKIFDVSPLKG